MARRRHGTTLCEVLCALVLLAGVAAWALHATAVAHRAIGDAVSGRRTLHRAAWVLADLDARPCDGVDISRTLIEARWHITAARRHAGSRYRDHVVLRSIRGDSVSLHHDGWCA